MSAGPILRGIVGRLLIYLAIIPVAAYVLFPDLLTTIGLWRVGALTDEAPEAPDAPPPTRPVESATPAPAPAPVQQVTVAERRTRHAEAGLLMVGTIDQCRRADAVLATMCDGSRTSPEVPATFADACAARDLAYAADAQDGLAQWRAAMPATIYDEALSISKSAFERQFAQVLVGRYSGVDVETLSRVATEPGCRIALRGPE